jgi:chitosanase
MSESEETILLYISDFMQMLASQYDFVFGTDAHLRVGRFLTQSAGRDFSLADLKFRLAPLLCRSAEQQELFYNAFEAFIQKKQTQELEAEHLVAARASFLTEDLNKPEEIEEDKTATIAPIRPERKAQPAKTKGRSGPIRIELAFPYNPVRIWNTAPMSQALRPLLEKEWSSTTEWDIPLSIRATIQNGGNPTFISRRRKVAPQYLVLIDQRSTRDHLAGLYAELALEWRRRDMDIEWFFYNFTPYRCWRDRRVPSSYTHIQRLAVEYPNAKLILIGEATGLLDLPDLRPSNLMRDLVDMFRAVALLAPKSTADWDNAELSLCQLIPVVPATVAGIATLVAQWNAPSVWTPLYWQRAVPEPSVPPLETGVAPEDAEEVVATLEYYLGKTAFTWLCATAVYPEIHYELTALLNDESISRRADLTEWEQNQVWQNALLRLSRLRWFREGEIPATVRRLLREQLPAEKWVLVRQELLAVFAASPPPPAESYAAHSMGKLQVIYTKANNETPDEDWRQLTNEGNLSIADIAEAIGDSFANAIEQRLNPPVQTYENQSNTGDYAYQQQSQIPYQEQLQEAYAEPPPPTESFPERGDEKALCILWVDDKPQNNSSIVNDMQRQHHMRFQSVLNTEGALNLIRTQYFDLVISDLGRPKDPVAGLNLLREFKKIGYRKPYAIYSTQIEETYQASLKEEGADLVTNLKEDLVKWISKYALQSDAADEHIQQNARPLQTEESFGQSEKVKQMAEQARKAIAGGQTEQAINLMEEQLESGNNTDWLNDILLLKGQHADLKRKQTLGLITNSETNIQHMKIANSLLDLLSQIEKDLATQSEQTYQGTGSGQDSESPKPEEKQGKWTGEINKNRIKNIITIFETGSNKPAYDALAVYADGKKDEKGNPTRQITYGFWQTTEQGNLRDLLMRYIEEKGQLAEAFQPYISKIWTQPLADDETFKNLLRQAGKEDPKMGEVQEAFFDARYYEAAYRFFTENGFSLPLSLLVILDSYTHSGSVLQALRNRFEEKTPSAGGDEKAWVNAYVRARYAWLSNHQNTILQKTAYRPQTFLKLIEQNEWLLEKPVWVNGIWSV